MVPPIRSRLSHSRHEPQGLVTRKPSTLRAVIDDLAVLVAMMLGRDMVQAPAEIRPDARGRAPVAGAPTALLPIPRRRPEP